MISPMTCPTCGKELPPAINGESALFPFCSVRCKQVDLLRWMNGEYAIVEPMNAAHWEEALGESEERLSGPAEPLD
jgi:endogenous inhibitor of DNA gyrase (YacG/DUF329 family)